jgi:hypothetical protein
LRGVRRQSERTIFNFSGAHTVRNIPLFIHGSITLFSETNIPPKMPIGFGRV